MPAGFEPDRSLSSDPLPAVVARLVQGPDVRREHGAPQAHRGHPARHLGGASTGFATLLRVPENGVHLVSGPLYHNGPFTMSALALLRGNHIVVMPRFDPAQALALIERHRVDWMYAVPTMMHRIWRLPEAERTRYDLSSLRVVFHMAAPCPTWLKQAWIEWLGPDRVLELYGGTEAQSFTVITGGEWLEHRGSVGRPLLGEMRILDADGRELPPGQVGEIWMRRGEDAPPSYRYVGARGQVAAGQLGVAR